MVAMNSAEVVTATDYYPFGMEMPGRSQSANGYRYGFNGMEKDSEVKGGNDDYDFGARMYDARLGRWKSIDPAFRKYSHLSPYHFVACNPIFYIELDGRVFDASNLTADQQAQMVDFLQSSLGGSFSVTIDVNGMITANKVKGQKKEARKALKNKSTRTIFENLNSEDIVELKVVPDAPDPNEPETGVNDLFEMRDEDGKDVLEINEKFFPLAQEAKDDVESKDKAEIQGGRMALGVLKSNLALALDEPITDNSIRASPGSGAPDTSPKDKYPKDGGGGSKIEPSPTPRVDEKRKVTPN